jgi:hypothetical protein
VAEVLRLTEEQRGRLMRVAEENEQEHTRLLAEVSAVRGRGADRISDPAGLSGRARSAHEAGSARLLALLTPEQQQQFARLKAGEG